jgi:hypothetical protein
MLIMLFNPLDLTVKTPVELFVIVYPRPSTKVLVTGKTMVCVVEPVKNCWLGLASVRVVVPAAVAVGAYPSLMLSITGSTALAIVVVPDKVVAPDADKVVNAPVDGVVAPIVELLIVAPEITGDVESSFVATAIAILTNSVLISVPRTIFSGSPGDSASLVAKLVLWI